MYPLLFTLSFLFLLGFTSLSELRSTFVDYRFKKFEREGRELDYRVKEVLLRSQFDKAKETLQLEEKVKATVDEKTDKKATKVVSAERRVYPLHFDECRPPNNSRLNFFLVINKEKDTGVLSAYETAARLLRRLYENAPFFSPQMEYRILDCLVQQKESTLNFFSPDDLATISLNNEKLQEAWEKMLMGAENSPSLLWYLTWKNGETKSEINLLFAPSELLAAIFNNDPLVEELNSFRESLLSELDYQEEHRKDKDLEDTETRSEINKRIEAKFHEVVGRNRFSGEYFAPLFDFSLGQIGDTFYFEEPTTHMRRRERLV